MAATAAVALGAGVLTVVGARSDGRAQAVAAAAGGAVAGSDLFRAKGCVSCHDGPDSADSPYQLAPDLKLLALVAGHRVPGLDGRAYVRQSIQEPQAFIVDGFEPSDHVLMPALPLTPAELDALVAFLLP